MFNLIKNTFNKNFSFLVILIIVIFCLYGKAINYELLFLDDSSLIESKINFVLDVKNLPKIFFLDCFYNNNTTYYRPILTLSVVLESLLFGYNPKVYHLTNILLFILSIYLIYLFFLKLKFNRNIVCLTCLLFAVHPVLTSCCVWIAARNDTLLLIFTMLIFFNLISYIESNKKINLILVSLFFMLSLLTKETGMIFIFICPLFIFLFDYKLSKNQIYNLILFLLIPIIIYFILRSNSVSSINLKDYLQYSNFILDNIFFGVMIYINKVLYPIYVPIVLYEQSFNIHEIVIPIIFVIMLSIIYCRNIIKRKIFIFGLLMFLLYLLPTFAIGLNQILFHRLLIPSIGLLIIFINVIYKISNKYKILNKYFIFLWIFIFLFFSIASYLQADKYKDNNIFIVTGYTDAPKYGTFINAMAKIYIKYENYDKALYFLSKLDDISLDKSLVDVAVILCKKNKFKEAEEILKESIEKNYNVELCYANLSMIYENDKNYDKALEYALKSYEINSYNIDVSLNLARMYRLNNKFEEAIDIYKKLLKFDKKNSEYYYSLGVLYNDIKDKNNAVKFLETACRLDPNNKISSKKLEEVKNII